jgi:alkanesulfonate monooxygenase SsuD/methylene tetrahydromethanopterin reductase-like flavin-dependent oxidoreductase (luciferase family)
MKLTFFHMQGYRDLPEDFSSRYESIWVNPPNDELCDPAMEGQYLRWNLKELELAASLGFDGVGTNEHHQNGYGFPMPNMTAFHLAASTQDVAIVLLGMTLPIYHPLRVAEEMAQIDALSGGRLVAGWPVGTAMDVNHCYGVTPTETRTRWGEAHDLIKAAWTRPGPFIWNGKYNKLRNVNPWPKPLQKPHPPIWLAGGGSVETWEIAARNNYMYSFLSFGGHLAGKAMMDEFWETNDKAGNDANPYRGGFAQIVMVADTDEEAERLYEKHVTNFYQKALHVGPQFGATPGYTSKRTLLTSIHRLQAASSAFADPAIRKKVTWKSAIESGQVIGGSPATVRERLAHATKEIRVGNWILLMQLQSMPHDLTNYNIRLFAEKVMPYIRDIWDDEWDASPYWPSGARKAKLPAPAGARIPAPAAE